LIWLVVAVLSLAPLAAPLDAAAQTSVRPARVGYLNLGAVSGTPGNPSVPRIIPALVSGLQELGHDVGRTLVLEFRHAEFKPERLPVLAVELVRLPVDVILVAGPAPLDAARKATQTIPIVMVAASDDPVRDGLVASLARPGGNITGLTFAVSPEIAGKQLELLRELAPAANRVRMVADADTIALRRVAEAIADAAPRLHFRAQEPLEAREPTQLDEAFVRAVRERTDALWIPMAGVTFAQRTRVAELALKHRMPVLGYFRELPEAGGLFSYGPDLRDIYRRAAGYVDRILRGARPAELPVEQPTKFELVVNLKTAKALGLTIPQSVLLRADEVIQ
jgi:putative ABC transport system substrate-binding protein